MRGEGELFFKTAFVPVFFYCLKINISNDTRLFKFRTTYTWGEKSIRVVDTSGKNQCTSIYGNELYIVTFSDYQTKYILFIILRLPLLFININFLRYRECQTITKYIHSPKFTNMSYHMRLFNGGGSYAYLLFFVHQL